MNKQKLFPDTIVKNSYEQIIADYSKNTYAIYLIFLFAITMIFVSLFFISVDVGVSTLGTIKAYGERNVITAPTSGQLQFIHIEENKQVQKGDTLCIVHTASILSQKPALLARKAELDDMVDDLQNLLKGRIKRFKSDTYRQSYTYYTVQLQDLQYKKDIVEKKYLRENRLYNKKVIAAADFEAVEAEYENCKRAIKVFLQGQRSQWQTDCITYENELREIETRLEQIEIQGNETVVCAPIAGTIQSLGNVNDGNYVHAGQNLIEISPDGNLLAECYVSSGDIGLLKIGMSGRVRVDAFNYNQWGILEGRISDISKDVIISNDNPIAYYKVYCSLDSHCLYLKNGFSGCVKKGMTVNVRFIVTRRTLFQLLYDKMDDWVNPTAPQNN